MKSINGQPIAQKQECSSPSLQASLRCYTLAFYPNAASDRNKAPPNQKKD